MALSTALSGDPSFFFKFFIILVNSPDIIFFCESEKPCISLLVVGERIDCNIHCSSIWVCSGWVNYSGGGALILQSGFLEVRLYSFLEFLMVLLESFIYIYAISIKYQHPTSWAIAINQSPFNPIHRSLRPVYGHFYKSMDHFLKSITCK